MTDENDFEALLRELEKTEQAVLGAAPKVGAKVKGTVFELGSEQAFVELGGKAEARMDLANLTDADGKVTVAVGDPIEGVVTGIDPDTGALILGKRQGKHLHGNAELEAAYRDGQPVEGQVTGAIKGGIEVQIAGQRAFCPASQVDIRFIEDLSTLVGERLSFRITKYEGGRRLNLVVSRRALLEEEQANRAIETRARLKEGAALTGTVTGIKDFGAFIDLGGIEGMVHVSELALGRVGHPQDVLQLGQQVEVQVLRIEQTGNPKRPEKIALSIRALARSPWSDVPARYPPGTRVTGNVTRTQPFGAFVELEPGIEGLVHISELGAGRRLNHPDEVIRTGQQVEATVLQVDPERQRISLSLDPNSSRADQPATLSQGNAPGNPERDDDAGPGTLGDLFKAQFDRQRRG